MALGSVSGRVIPPLTVRMARASNPRGTAAMWVRDRLDGLFTDGDFTDWYPADGRRGLSPAQLVLVSVLQYAENLTDRQAADAVRGLQISLEAARNKLASLDRLARNRNPVSLGMSIIHGEGQ
ncbi:hypothetical protein ABZ835_48120 [Streptomyces sp. NPDC047461]|uniref:hypothetical protein n=1 Tax=Streptomyces sp. NPDC047461 TaxID=3155619 RepID=UPI0034047436